jgi:glycosyltransferase involved in cell wall biosynthesis
MRIGIDFRLLSYGRAYVNRGMGRFTQRQLREVLRLPAGGAGDDFVLLVQPGHDPGLLLPEIAAAPNVKCVEVLPQQSVQSASPVAAAPPRPPVPPGGDPPLDLLRRTAELGALLAGLGVDVFHATTPLLPAEPAFWRCDGCALVATHYDLIPLIYPDHYFGAGRAAERGAYLRSVRALRHADRLIAISEFARGEAAGLLGLPERRIDVAYPTADPCFRVLAAAEAEAQLAGLRRRCRLDGDFVLTVTHLHHAKNLPTLLAAFALLPQAWRRRHPLVVAGDFDAAGSRRLAGWVRAAGIEAEVVVPGFVGDDELAALYNAALFCVHPSRYEGFALPVLEAIRCGAPVVAGNVSAPAEVLGAAGLLVDPEDPAAMARAMERLAGDGALRGEMRAAGLARAAAFPPEQLGRATRETYRQALAATAADRARPRRRRRLAIWSPLPPQPTGVADYTVELAGAIRGWADCELFADDAVWPAEELSDAWPIHHHSAFERRHRWRPFDLVVYQVGASLFHLYMTEAIQRRPGLLVLHDMTWGYVRFELFGAGWPLAEVRRELLAAGGPAALAEYEAIAGLEPRDRTAPTEAFLDRHLLLGALVDSSLAQVVHLPSAPRELAAHYPRARVFTFPMGVEDPWLYLAGAAVAEAGCGPGSAGGGPAEDPAPDPGSGPAAALALDALRRRFNLPPDAFVFGAFGIADPVKRLESAVRALARLGAGAPAPLLLVVGRFSRADYRRRIEELAGELGVASRVRLFGNVGKADLNLLLLVCDAIVNLRFPFRKQMSATLMRAVAASKPVAITDVPDWGHFPASFCHRVAPGEAEDEQLAAWLGALALDPQRARAASRAAREYYIQQATLNLMSEHYRNVVENLVGPRDAEAGSTAMPAIPATRPLPVIPPIPAAPPIPAIPPMPANPTFTPIAGPWRSAPAAPGCLEAPPAMTAEPGREAPAAFPAGAAAAEEAAAAAALEVAFARWDAVRGRSSLRGPARGPLASRALGFVRRTVRRVRDLGIAWDRERELLREMLDALAMQRRHREETAGALALVEGLAAEIRRLAAAQEAAAQEVELRELATRQHSLAARLAEMAVRQHAVEEGLLGQSRAPTMEPGSHDRNGWEKT